MGDKDKETGGRRGRTGGAAGGATGGNVAGASQTPESEKSELLDMVEQLKTNMKNEFDKVTSVLDKIKTYDQRVQKLETDAEETEERLGMIENTLRRPKEFEYSRTIVISNINKDLREDDENVANMVRLEIAGKILREGLKLDPIPVIVAVARLPHNPETHSSPGLKIEFLDEATRDIALKYAKNLKPPSPYSKLKVRRSMSKGERDMILAYRNLYFSLLPQGIEIDYMHPSGVLVRKRHQPRQQHPFPRPTAAAAAATATSAATTISTPMLPNQSLMPRNAFRPNGPNGPNAPYPRAPGSFGLNVLGI